MIREATAADTPRLVEMTTHFLQSTRYGALFRADPVFIGKLIDLVLEHGVILVAEIDSVEPHWEQGGRFKPIIGMIALTALPHLLTGIPYGDEQAWWVEPEHRAGMVGPRLMQAAERWCRENGLNMVKMIAPEGSDVGKFYTRQGYEAVETAFVKLL